MPIASVFDLGAVDAAFAAELREQMAEVETGLRAATVSDYPFISETASHLLDAGGKRFRPLLTLVSAHLADARAPGVIPAAVAVELTHLATLYHDDVMDEAPVRRGTESANSRWSNTIAILTGDFLFARASQMLADLGAEAVRVQAHTFERLVKGQIRESVGPENGRDPVEHYLQVVADKTGSLIATAGRFGGMMSGADPATTDLLTRYGERIGVAFQLSDDLLDVAAETADSGKTPGTDLREGVRTLPVMLALRSQAPEDRRLLELLGEDLADDDVHGEALGLLRAHPAMLEARAVLAQWAQLARSELTQLVPGPARDTLEWLCEYVVDRTG